MPWQATSIWKAVGEKEKVVDFLSGGDCKMLVPLSFFILNNPKF